MKCISVSSTCIVIPNISLSNNLEAYTGLTLKLIYIPFASELAIFLFIYFFGAAERRGWQGGMLFRSRRDFSLGILRRESTDGVFKKELTQHLEGELTNFSLTKIKPTNQIWLVRRGGTTRRHFQRAGSKTTLPVFVFTVEC